MTLSGEPFGAWMSGDAETYQPPSLMAQDYQRIEQFEKRGRHYEQIDRSNACRMVAQEGLPEGAELVSHLSLRGCSLEHHIHVTRSNPFDIPNGQLIL
jgi:hypothetical protein